MMARSRHGVVAALFAVAVLPLPASATGSAIDLQELIDTAPSGSTVVLTPGTYRGGVTIDRPLTIEGAPGAVIDAGGEGTAITVATADVTLRGLRIRDTGISSTDEDSAISTEGAARLLIEDCIIEDALFGVFLRQSPDAVIRGSVIGAKDLDPARRGDALRLWESPGALIEDNIVAGGRDGAFYFSDDLVVRGNRLTGGRYGLHFMSSHGIVIERNLVAGNSVGVYLMYSGEIELRANVLAGNHGPSGYGLGLKDVDGLAVVDNHFVGNRVGIYFDNAPVLPVTTHTITRNLFAFNEVGLLFNPSVHGNLISGNAFVQNLVHVSLSGAGTLRGNSWSDGGIGNYWDDFRGYDADGDGVGDITYRSEDLYSALVDRHPSILLFAGTPAARAVDMASRLFPSVRPEPRVVDEWPLTSMPELADPIPGAFPTDPTVLLLVSALMLVVAAAVITAASGLRRAA